MTSFPVPPARRVPPRAFRAGRGRPAGRARIGLLAPALGFAGGTVGYLPLLSLLLPLRIEAIAPDSRFGVLTAATVAGGVVAGGANILFGWASDRTLARGGGRRGWIVAGLLATLAAYAGVAAAASPVGIVLAVMVFQASINLLLAPLVALMAEEVPDARKGALAGLLAGAQPAAAAFCPLLVAAVPSFGGRLAVVGALAALCLAPLLLGASGVAAVPAAARAVPPRRDLAVAWAGRLLFQIAGSVLFAYLLFVMEGLAPEVGAAAMPGRVAGLMLVAGVAPLPVAVLLGRWSDRAGRRKPFVVAAAAIAAAGLATMAAAGGWRVAALGYAVYAVGNGAFLSLQIGFAMELLPDPRRRGRDLGLVNLANTLPMLVGPVLTWRLATPHALAPLLGTLAALSLAGGLTTIAIRGRA